MISTHECNTLIKFITGHHKDFRFRWLRADRSAPFEESALHELNIDNGRQYQDIRPYLYKIGPSENYR